MQTALFSYNMQWINNEHTLRVHVDCTQQCSTLQWTLCTKQHNSSRTQYSDKYWNLTIEIKPSLENVLV